MIKHLNDLNEHTKHVIDWASVVTVLGTLANILPSIAALWTIIWTTIRIYETKTVQKWFSKKKQDAEQI